MYQKAGHLVHVADRGKTISLQRIFFPFPQMKQMLIEEQLLHYIRLVHQIPSAASCKHAPCQRCHPSGFWCRWLRFLRLEPRSWWRLRQECISRLDLVRPTIHNLHAETSLLTPQQLQIHQRHSRNTSTKATTRHCSRHQHDETYLPYRRDHGYHYLLCNPAFRSAVCLLPWLCVSWCVEKGEERPGVEEAGTA